MAENQPPQSTNAPAAKTRNPIERFLVWGVIGVLAVAAGFEFQSKRAHETALKTLQDGIEAVDQDAKHPEITETDVKKAVGDKQPSRTKDYEPGKSAANGAKRMEVYTWFTLNPANTREMYVWYTGKGKDGKEVATVLEVQATETISAPPKLATGKEEAGSDARMAGGPDGATMSGRGMAPPGGPGGRGGQRGRPAAGPPVHDANKPNGDDAKSADADKPSDEKSSDDKPSDEKPAEEKKTDE